MDEDPTSPQHKIYEHSPKGTADPHPASPPPPPQSPSPFEPRPAERAPELPESKDHDRLRLATSTIVQQGLSLREAAERYGVDLDTLHVWHRTYVNFIGKDLFAATNVNQPERIEIDEEASRKFDENWEKMMRQAELERPQLSPMRKRLLASPFTRWMFRDEKLDKVTVSGAVAVIAFSLLAIRAGTHHLGTEDSGSEPGEVAIDPATAFDLSKPDTIDDDQTASVLNQVAEVLEEFSKLKTWQERLPYVRNPERVKPLMATYYEDHADGSMTGLIIEREVSFIKREEKTFLLMRGQRPSLDGTPGEMQPLVFLAELRKGDPCALFDWEVLVNYQPVSWDEFITTRPTATAPFRVRVAAGDYYNQPFMDNQEYVSFALLPMHGDRTFYGFVQRGSALAAQLGSSVSKELQGHRAMILNLRYPEDAKFDNILEIESVAADSWLGE